MRVYFEYIEAKATQPMTEQPDKVFRAKVPGGWFIYVLSSNHLWRTGEGAGFFYPDPEHKWDGSSLPLP